MKLTCTAYDVIKCNSNSMELLPFVSVDNGRNLAIIQSLAKLFKKKKIKRKINLSMV